jgi:hypothetical protein
MRPDGSGPDTVWKFTRTDKRTDKTAEPGKGQEVLRRALTNQVVYVLPSSSSSISVDSEPIVFRTGIPATISVENLPAKAHGSRKLNMDHFMKFYDLVDAQDKPEPAVHEPPPTRILEVEPDYCPPGRI